MSFNVKALTTRDGAAIIIEDVSDGFEITANPGTVNEAGATVERLTYCHGARAGQRVRLQMHGQQFSGDVVTDVTYAFTSIEALFIERKQAGDRTLYFFHLLGTLDGSPHYLRAPLHYTGDPRTTTVVVCKPYESAKFSRSAKHVEIRHRRERPDRLNYEQQYDLYAEPVLFAPQAAPEEDRSRLAS